MKVRKATAQDIRSLIFLAEQAGTIAKWNPMEYRRLFGPENQDRRVTLVIEENGKVQGFIVAGLVLDEWEIENIAIASPARRRGLGSCLLNEFLNHAENSGGKCVFLEVRESNAAARALYRQRGFTESGRRQSYYQNPCEDALVMKYSFPQAR